MPVFSENIIIYMFFFLSYLMLIALMFKKPYSYSYSFFSSILFLGIVFKYLLHFFYEHHYIEPIGSFDLDKGDWIPVLTTSAVGAAGLITVRLLQLKISIPSLSDSNGLQCFSRFFDRRRYACWGVIFSVVIALSLFNYHFAIYQIGVIPRLILPFHFNAIIAFLITIAFPLIMTFLLWLSFQSKKTNVKMLGLVVFISLSTILSLSTLSRSFFLIMTIPLGLLLIYGRHSGFILSISTRMIAIVLVVAAFSSTVVGVTFLRADVYQLTISPVISSKSQSEHGNPQSKSNRLLVVDNWKGLVSTLAVGRWIGLEGIMAVSAHPDKNSDLFMSALKESPSKGADLTYQRILGASNQYAEQDTNKFLFMSVPGPIAFSYISGNYLIVFVFMMIAMLMMIMIEKLTEAVLANPLSVMFIALSMAYTYMNFYSPYLFLVKVIEVILLLLIGGLFFYILGWKKRVEQNG